MVRRGTARLLVVGRNPRSPSDLHPPLPEARQRKVALIELSRYTLLYVAHKDLGISVRLGLPVNVGVR